MDFFFQRQNPIKSSVEAEIHHGFPVFFRHSSLCAGGHTRPFSSRAWNAACRGCLVLVAEFSRWNCHPSHDARLRENSHKTRSLSQHSGPSIHLLPHSRRRTSPVKCKSALPSGWRERERERGREGEVHRQFLPSLIPLGPPLCTSQEF